MLIMIIHIISNVLIFIIITFITNFNFFFFFFFFLQFHISRTRKAVWRKCS
jgi:hypothetical protein